MQSHSQDGWDAIEADAYEIKSNLSSFALVDRRLATYCQNRGPKPEGAVTASSVKTASTVAETTAFSPSSSCSTPTSSGFFSSRGKNREGQISPVNDYDDEIMQHRIDADAEDVTASLCINTVANSSSRLEMRVSAADHPLNCIAIHDPSDTLQGGPAKGGLRKFACADQIDSEQLGRVKNLLKAKIESHRSESGQSVAAAALKKELLLWPKTLNQLNENEVCKLRSSLSEIEEALQNSQQKSTVLEIDNQTMASEIDALSTLCAMLSSEKGDLKKSLKALQDSHEELEEEIISLVEDVETKVAEIDILSELSAYETSDLRGRLRAVEGDNSVLERSFTEHDEEKYRHETCITDLEEEVSSLRRRMVDAEAERQQVECKMSKFTAEVESLSALAANRQTKKEEAEALLRALVNETREGTELFNIEINACKVMLENLEEKNAEPEAERLKMATAFESMALLASTRLSEKEKAETCSWALQLTMEKQTVRYTTDLKAYGDEVESLKEINKQMEAENKKLWLSEKQEAEKCMHDLRLTMEEQTERYEADVKAGSDKVESLKDVNKRVKSEHHKLRLSEKQEAEMGLQALQLTMEERRELYERNIKACGDEVASLKETNERMKSENEKLIAEIESLSSVALSKSATIKHSDLPLLALNKSRQLANKCQKSAKNCEAEVQHANDARKAELCSEQDKDDTGTALGMDSISLREATIRLRELSYQEESPNQRHSKGLRVGRKKARGLSEKNRTHGEKLQHDDSTHQLGSMQHFVWLVLLWGLTILLYRFMSGN